MRVLQMMVLVFFLMFLIAQAKADLSLIYQSDDVDLTAQNIHSDSQVELAKYFDYVFAQIPSVIKSQNRKFILDFPETGRDKSAVPYGVSTKSNNVIKDAYIKLIPVEGLVKVGGEFAADRKVTVGYLLDYRIVLPPDKTSGYPKHYYYLMDNYVYVKIYSGDNFKESRSKRDIISLDVDGDIVAEGKIVVKIKQKIVEMHTSCYTVCDENGNCTTECHTYTVTYYKYHTYTLTVRDELKVVKPTFTEVYALLGENKVREYWIIPSRTVAYLSDEHGHIILAGLKYYATYRYITKVNIYSKSGYITKDLDEPAYIIVAVPSCNLLPDVSCWVEDVKGVNVTVSEIPNFKPGVNLMEIKAVRIRYSGYVVPLDFFMNKVPVSFHEKRIVKPNVDVQVEKVGEDKYKVRMYITYGGKKYNGPVYINFRTASFNVTARNGLVELTFNKSGVLSYLIPSNLPNDWYLSKDNIFVDTYSGSFAVGKPPSYVIAIEQFFAIFAAAVPFIAFYFVLKWIFGKEEEEEYI